MSHWINTQASLSLLAEMDVAFPNREHGAMEGTIGDLAHASIASDHNPDDTPGVRAGGSDADSTPEVHARDLNSVLSRPGWTLFRVFDLIRARAAAGVEKRVQYMIIDRKITSRSWNWTWRAYNGADPHIAHGHVSFRYGSGAGQDNPENITGPWGILATVQAEQRGMNIVAYVQMDGKLPVLHQSMSDPVDETGTRWIRRAQLLAQATPDGDYGPATAAAIKAVMADDDHRTTSNGTVIGEAEWRRLTGLW